MTAPSDPAAPADGADGDAADEARKPNDGTVPLARTALGLTHFNTLAFSFPLFATPIVSVKILKLTFKSDHHVMKDNASDWDNTGTLFPKPEWTFGKPSAPISHTKGASVGVEIVLEVNPGDADDTSCKVEGTAAFGSLAFSLTATLKGGNISETITGNHVTLSPDTVAKLTGDIAWKATATAKGTVFDAGASFGHTVYATFAAPISVPGAEAGVTLRRMDRAIQLVAATGSSDSHTIVAALMQLFPGYTLTTDPAVPAEFKHPTYFNTVGGAWPLADFIPQSAECQAIVRLVRAVIKQVGCPGTAETVLVWADPDVGGGATALEAVYPAGGLDDKSKVVAGKKWFAVLVDRFPEVGKFYDIESSSAPTYMGLNNFEACLRFTDGGVTKYYGGGAGAYDSKDQVILAFYALAWISLHVVGGVQKCKVEQVVKRWRRADGSII